MTGHYARHAKIPVEAALRERKRALADELVEGVAVSVVLTERRRQARASANAEGGRGLRNVVCTVRKDSEDLSGAAESRNVEQPE